MIEMRRLIRPDGTKILQYRYRNQTLVDGFYTHEWEWSEWQNVPEVYEINDSNRT